MKQVAAVSWLTISFVEVQVFTDTSRDHAMLRVLNLGVQICCCKVQSSYLGRAMRKCVPGHMRTVKA